MDSTNFCGIEVKNKMLIPEYMLELSKEELKRIIITRSKDIQTFLKSGEHDTAMLQSNALKVYKAELERRE